jgi:hypothetical protein
VTGATNPAPHARHDVSTSAPTPDDQRPAGHARHPTLVCPSALLNVPSGHAWHADADVAPATSLNRPTPHGVHAVDPGDDHDPGGHAPHEPAGHEMQTDSDVPPVTLADVPAGQGMHSRPCKAYEPLEHSRHVDDPDDTATRPAVQDTQVVTLVAPVEWLAVPAGHPFAATPVKQ